MLVALSKIAVQVRKKSDRRVKPDAEIFARGADITERDNANLALAASRIMPVLTELFDRGGIDEAELLRLVYRMAGEVFEAEDDIPTGQEWLVSGADPTSTVIEDGLLTSPDLSYSALDYGETITQIECTFSFVPGTGTNDATLSTLVMIADKAMLGLSDMLHLLFSPTDWVLQKRVAAGAFTEIARGSHTLIMDGTPYHISMKIDGDTATIIAADGSTTLVTDTDISGMAVRYACWEISPQTNGYIGRFNSIGIGRSIGRALIANGAGAPMAELTQLKGRGITKKQTVNATLSGGAGWYRIATEAVLGTYAIAGRVKICATIPGIADQGFEFTCKCILFSGTSEVLQVQNIMFVAGIQYVRLSADTDAPYPMGLDIYYPYEWPCTIRVDFEGYFQPVFEPVVGATDYADQTATLTLT